jgi:ribose transport system permease protein
MPARTRRFIAKYGVLITLGILILIFGTARPDSFLSGQNFRTIALYVGPLLIFGSCLTLVLAMGDFDLSFPYTVGFTSAITILLITEQGWSWPLAALAGLAVAALVGVLNGYLVRIVGASSFIITLAVGTALSGGELRLTGGQTIFTGIPHSYVRIGQGTFLGLNISVWIALIITLIFYVVLELTETGRYVYAIGSNQDAAALAGVRVIRMTFFGFVVVAICAAIGGIILTSQAASQYPDSGTPFLLPAYAAVFLGSAVFRPGTFNIPGTIVGAIMLGVIQNGVVILNFSAAYVSIVQGAILAAAVCIGRLEGKRG